ncbi:MAG: 6-phosphogluconolactonase [Deltaproteobacteria bacterium]|nr:6-phosphogluconolactonase [Deltaproteobacteria bacterium]
MKIMIASDPADLARKGAAIVSQTAQMSVALRGRFMVALSGGSTPRPMHRLLCEAPHLNEIPWDRTHIFWVDERCVPADDPASNYGAARADLLDRVPVLPHQVHPMPMNLSPEEAAATCQEELVRFFQSPPSEIPVFDLIILGIGTDGHTASLFPGDNALREQERLVVPVRGGDPDVDRLTMTLPLLNNALEIVFLVSGKRKAPILKSILEGPPGKYPAQMIQPIHGNLTWLLDREAAPRRHW